ncbi:class 1b ribonucleoside-diphosphate reductase subunit alpha [[Acholeplasma] multilocale]|uniref:class 1b ribonucleoside-diphosphate reductase subunit alpha n=1 Tax=[Acholeplasma] multilocale TaxID=264638 RepID=UPI0004796AEA|nr:class 1b ribonucleoside-diphosphate reductase subunit alpha [[Acholeplasma] multilocale]
MKNNINDTNEEYVRLNAMSKLLGKGTDNFHLDVEAAKSYYKNHVNPRMKKFESTKERFKYLIENKYYDDEIVGKYEIKQIDELLKYAESFNFEFPSFIGALKFFNSYCLKNNDGSQYLEDYQHRVLMNALFLADGNFEYAKNLIKQIMIGRFQPATPTFLNAGKKQRGEYVSCYLLRVEDNMESIGRAITTSLQLSKRGGGVALCLTNVREIGAPIKNIKNLARGVIPIMKILEDSFSYADQLGQRQGAGAVYLNVHHPDILEFLDTKKENADEKVRIKSLSLGIVMTNILFELAKRNEPVALFSPYDINKVYGKPMSDISITDEYHNLVNNPEIKKTLIDARKLFNKIAELHFESGYPYLMFDDTVNANNAFNDRIIMSNLCSEILQPNTPSEFSTDLNFTKKGEDVCCNLGSLNIAKAMESGSSFPDLILDSITALDHVSRMAGFDSAPSIENGNANNHAIGLGAMNLHGFLATNFINYNSKEAIDFTNMFFYTMAYHAYLSSHKLALKFGKFKNFKGSKYETGEYFEKYTNCDENKWTFETETIRDLFSKYQINIPTQSDWKKLVEKIKKDGLANSHLMAIAPTGSISYLSSCTPGIQPVVAPIETRKEGKLGRVYVPSYKINFDNMGYYALGAFEMGPDPIIDIAATAQQHIDQGIALTLFMTDKATTRDLNKAYIRAFSTGVGTIYYVRIRQDILENSENYECDACVL